MQAKIDCRLPRILVAWIEIESFKPRDAARHGLREVRRPEQLQHGSRERLITPQCDAPLFPDRPRIAERGIEIGKGHLPSPFIESEDQSSEHPGNLPQPGIRQAANYPDND